MDHEGLPSGNGVHTCEGDVHYKGGRRDEGLPVPIAHASSMDYRLVQLSRIRWSDLYRWSIISETLESLDSLDGGSAHCKASVYPGHRNTELCRRTSVLQAGFEIMIAVTRSTRPHYMSSRLENFLFAMTKESDRLPTPTSLPLVPIEQEAWWVSELVWIWRRGDKPCPPWEPLLDIWLKHSPEAKWYYVVSVRLTRQWGGSAVIRHFHRSDGLIFDYLTTLLNCLC